jgi:hypothetical protein
VSLLSTQREFERWLTCETVGLHERFGARPQAGLAVYLNNYRSQLMSCLASSFPVTRAYLGDLAFDSAAAAHIEDSPPHAWTLDAYAMEFPATLERLHVSPTGELARLELGLAMAFVGPDASPVDTASLRNIDWDAAVLQLAPTFALLSVTTDVCALWAAIRVQRPPPVDLRLAEPASIAIWRNAFESRFRAVTSIEADALSQIRMRRSYGEICRRLVERMGKEQGIAMAGGLLAQWLTDGLIVGVAPTRAGRGGG